MGALSGPCQRVLRALSGVTALTRLRLPWSQPQPQPSRGSQPSVTCQSLPAPGGSGLALVHHSVRLVDLPPKRSGLAGPADPLAALAAAAAATAALAAPGSGAHAGGTNPVDSNQSVLAAGELGLAVVEEGSAPAAAAADIAAATMVTVAAAVTVAPVAPAVAAAADALAGPAAAAADAAGGQQQHQQQEQLAGDRLEVHLIDLRHVPPSSAAAAAGGVAAVADAMARLGRELGAESVVGLDAEWEPELRPGLRHRISVIQLSSATRCWILQPGGGGGGEAGGGAEGKGEEAEEARRPQTAEGAAATAAAAGLLPAEVVRLLTDPRVIKAGVGIQEDVRRLERDFGVRVRGAVDVRLVVQRVAPACLAAGGSLRALSAALLGRELDKSAQRSHWGAEGQLDEGQVAYAAHDAWLSRELLCELHRRHLRQRQDAGEAATPPPQPPLPLPEQHPSPQSAQVAGAITTTQPGGDGGDGGGGGGGSSSLLEFAGPFLDVFNSIKAKRLDKALGPPPPVAVAAAVAAAAVRQPGKRQVAASTAVAAAGGASGGGGGGGGGAAGLRKKERKLETRKSVLYENCRLLAPDGTVLCTCGTKKVHWYIQRGLARVVAENPTTIQLNFEPRGRGHADDQYYLADKENRCCVCGSGGEYLRHSVVPHCYRQHFPLSMKGHLSHDIVLMCPTCHKACSATDQRRMEALGAQFRAPLGAATAAKFRHDSNLGAVRSAGRALANKKVVIPPARRRELEALLAAHFGVEPEAVDEALVQRAAHVDPRTEDENWRSHAELVVRALGGRDQLELFVRGWRQHFLDSMRPRFMPPHWRVDACVANSSMADEEGEGGGGRRRGGATAAGNEIEQEVTEAGDYGWQKEAEEGAEEEEEEEEGQEQEAEEEEGQEEEEEEEEK